MSVFSRIIPFSWKEIRIYLLGLFLILSLFSIGIFRDVRVFFQTQLYATGNGIQNIVEFIFREKGDTENVMRTLKERTSQLHAMIAENAIISQENIELKQSLNVISSRPTLFEHARVASIATKYTSSSQQLLRIYAGAREGVQKDDIVTSPDGYFIGIIDSVNEESSLVRLLQDTRLSIPVKALNTRDTRGLIVGTGGFQLNLQYVPIQSDIQVGSLIMTSGIDGRYPQGLLIGEVSEIHTQENTPFQDIAVNPFVDARDLLTVLIL